MYSFLYLLGWLPCLLTMLDFDFVKLGPEDEGERAIDEKPTAESGVPLAQEDGHDETARVWHPEDTEGRMSFDAEIEC